MALFVAISMIFLPSLPAGLVSCLGAGFDAWCLKNSIMMISKLKKTLKKIIIRRCKEGLLYGCAFFILGLYFYFTNTDTNKTITNGLFIVSFVLIYNYIIYKILTSNTEE